MMERMSPYVANRIGWVAVFAVAAMAPSFCGAEIIISEIMYDPSGSDAKREWVEIHNSGEFAVALNGWKFVDASNHILNAPPKNGGRGGLVIAPGEYAIIASDAATFLSEYPSVVTVIDSAMSLKNAGGTIGLIRQSGGTVSAAYTSDLGAHGDGASLQRHEGTWVHARPTPGIANAAKSEVANADASARTRIAGNASAHGTSDVPVAARDDSMGQSASVESAAIASVRPAASNSMLWWIAALAFSLVVAAIVALIMRAQDDEWTIEE